MARSFKSELAKLSEYGKQKWATTLTSFIKIGLKKSFINSTFFEVLINLFLNSLIFANSLLDDPVLNV